jgi:hypothetical protein
MSGPRYYRARCDSCGALAAPFTAKPGAVRAAASGWTPSVGRHVRPWQTGSTIPDHLPLVALCRRCLGLKPAESEQVAS